MFSRRAVLAGAVPLLMPGSARAAEAGPVQVYAAMTLRAALGAALEAYRRQGGAATAMHCHVAHAFA